MKKTRLITLSILTLLMAFELCLVRPIVNGETINQAPKDTTSFENKVIDNYSSFIDENQYDLDDDVIVTIKFKENKSRNAIEQEIIDKELNRLDYLETYYVTANNEYANSLNIRNQPKYTCKFGPFVTYTYDSYDEFLVLDYKILKNNNCNFIETIFIDSSYCEDAADFSSSIYVDDYLFADALLDVGIFSSNQYDGTGIKIGILESGVTNNFSNLQNTTYELKPNYSSQTEHAFCTSSILGGDNGIAKGSSLYFASASNTTDFFSCIDWLVVKEVNVVNISCGGDRGHYSCKSAYADYISRTQSMTIVAAVGNGADWMAISPSTGVNVISVGGIEVHHLMYKTSSYGIMSQYTKSTINPTLVAPGAKIINIPNIPLDYDVTGTSFAAPFVTGIVALLMEEFPNLKSHPEQVMSLLAISCIPVVGQTTLYDNNAGFGLVNYQNARKYYNSYYNYSISGEIDENTVITQKNITLEFGGSIIANTCIFFNSEEVDSIDDVVVMDYTEICLAIYDSNTGQLLMNGTQRSNFSYLEYKNETNLGNNPTTSFTIKVYTTIDKETIDTEVCSLTYRKMNHQTYYADGDDVSSVQTRSGTDMYYLGYLSGDEAYVGYIDNFYYGVGEVSYDLSGYNSIANCFMWIDNTGYSDDATCLLYDNLYNYYGLCEVEEDSMIMVDITSIVLNYSIDSFYLIPVPLEDYEEPIEFESTDLVFEIVCWVWGI